jgi:hypothetical protein
MHHIKITDIVEYPHFVVIMSKIIIFAGKLAWMLKVSFLPTAFVGNIFQSDKY